MNWSRAGLGIFGMCTTALGIALLAYPDLATWGPVSSLTERLLETEPAYLFIGFGSAVAVVIVVLARSATATSSPAPRASNEPNPTASGSSVGGQPKGYESITRDVDSVQAIALGGDPYRSLIDSIRDKAVTSYATSARITEPAARERIEAGRWPDDHVARAVLTDRFPIQDRLRLSLVPVRERRRRIERTLDAIERLQED